MSSANDQAGRSGGEPVDPTDADAVIALFGAVCDRAAAILASNDDWTMSGERATQYSIDVDIDVACVSALHDAGLAVLSEETGLSTPPGVGDDHVVVVDPLDGSTNASRGLPWCATALCLVSHGEPVVAMVLNLRTGVRYDAVVGRGARRDGATIRISAQRELGEAIVAVNARPPDGFRPAQYRSMGATALDIVSVADGGFDATIDFDHDMIGVWDYLAAITILHEAGGVSADAEGRELLTLEHAARRRPVTASSSQLLAALLDSGAPR
ncbi:MAG: inositol monophosphatase [Ilumatobacter sp.]